MEKVENAQEIDLQPELRFSLPSAKDVLAIYRAEVNDLIADFIKINAEADVQIALQKRESNVEVCYSMPANKDDQEQSGPVNSIVIIEPETLVMRLFGVLYAFLIAFGEAAIRQQDQKTQINEAECRRMAEEWAAAEKNQISVWEKVKLFFRQSSRSAVVQQITSGDTENK
jgi:hypothetical protein